MYIARFDALYGRQSVDKKDSISIESQLEFCRYETHGGDYREYKDKGYSGKNTDRPDFNRMMRDIRAGLVKRVIVYKLDRISRSILDFATMMGIFQKYNVEFVSSTEKFDTSTPIGRAMLNICIVFAQLERETIQMRVSDAYHSRARKGFLMGCQPPYGYRRVPHVIDGIHTAQYEEVPEEMQQVELLYRLYVDETRPDGSLYSSYALMAYLVDHGIKHLRGKCWTPALIASILANPIYAQADLNLYDFFKSQGAEIVNPIELWQGGNGCYLYRPAGTTNGTMRSYKDRTVVLAPHIGKIPSDMWIRARTRAMNHRTRATSKGAKSSWLIGKTKCGKCNHALIISGRAPSPRYMQCSYKNSTRGVGCPGPGCTIHADKVERYVFEQIKEKLSAFRSLENMDVQTASPKAIENRIRLTQIDEEIEGLIAKVSSANETLMRLINQKVEELDAERRSLSMENVSMNAYSSGTYATIFDHVESWETTSIEERERVVDAFIQKITIADGKMDIVWNI